MEREIRWARWSILSMAIVSASTLLSSCDRATPPQASTSERVSFTYSCCTTNTTVRPGRDVHVGWTRTGAPSPSQATIRISLFATLEGPFGSVKQLKKPLSTLVTTSITAAPVEISNWTEAMPVSSIRIPKDAPRGYYNLAWRVANGSSWSSSGAAVIYVG
jgi:hypothetical protein